MKYILLSGLCLLLTVQVYGQGCISSPIYNDTANCGKRVFVQDNVPACESVYRLHVGCSVNDASSARENAVWYSFYGLRSAKIGFLITPENPSDDYNWTLFDVTKYRFDLPGNLDYSIVGGNQSEKGGRTGASSDGKDTLICQTPAHSPPYPSPYSKMPQIKKGHLYLLMVSHHSGAVQNGYTLSFGHNYDAIIDTASPRLKKVEAACDGRSITVFLTRDTMRFSPNMPIHPIGIRSASLAADGSDFKLLHTSVGIQSAYSKHVKFSLASLTLELNGRLTPGHYTLVMQKGSDGNTLLGNCPNKSIPVGARLEFKVPYIPPTPMKSVVKPGCNSKNIRVVFADKIDCNTVAADGSDFSIVNVKTGKQLSITGAEGWHCNYNLSDTVEIYLTRPVFKTGMYRLTLKTGTDGNSILNECGMASPPDTLTFESAGAVSAVINPKIQYACNSVKVTLNNPGTNGVNKWKWIRSSGDTSSGSSLSFIDTTFETQTILLKVSNGKCDADDSITLRFNKDYYLQAGFAMASLICPQDPLKIKNISKGMHITQWSWSFGNGKYSSQKDPGIQHYPVSTFTKEYPVALTITNSQGCRDTATKKVEVLNTCEVYVPTAFTPNHDGKNDSLHPLNAFLTKYLSFKVYNRWGQLLFQTRDWTRGWNGRYHGKPQPKGAYVWILHFVNTKTGEKVARKGTALLIR